MLLKGEREGRKQNLRLILFTRPVSLCVHSKKQSSPVLILYSFCINFECFQIASLLGTCVIPSKCTGYTWRQSAFTILLILSKTQNIYVCSRSYQCETTADDSQVQVLIPLGPHTWLTEVNTPSVGEKQLSLGAQTLEPDCLGSHSSSDTEQFYDHRQVS